MSAPNNKPIHPPLSDLEKSIKDVLMQHVELLAGLIGIRHDSRPTTLEATVAFIKRECKKLDQTVNVETYPTPQWEAKNLVVEWEGTTKPDEIVIVGAHYDTVRLTPGADDNASAVAALLVACQQLMHQKFERTLRFVAFANEEPPHFIGPTMGSRVYAERCKERGDQITAMVCLEMLGYYNTQANSQTYPKELPKFLNPLMRSTGDFIAFVSDLKTRKQLRRFTKAFKAAVDFPVVSHAIPKASDILWVSDHGPFWDEGYPALMVTDTSFFRNPHYHEMTDTPETLDYDRMARVTAGVIEGIRTLAKQANS